MIIVQIKQKINYSVAYIVTPVKVGRNYVNNIQRINVKTKVFTVKFFVLPIKRSTHGSAAGLKPDSAGQAKSENSPAITERPLAVVKAEKSDLDAAYEKGYAAACEEGEVRMAELKMPSIWRSLHTQMSRLNLIRLLYKAKPEVVMREYTQGMLKDKRVAAIMHDNFSLLLRLGKKEDVLLIQRQFFKNVFLPAAALRAALNSSTLGANSFTAKKNGGLKRAEKRFLEDDGLNFLLSKSEDFSNLEGFDYKAFCNEIKDTMVSYRYYQMYLALDLLYKLKQVKALDERFIRMEKAINDSISVDKIEVLATEAAIRNLLSLSIQENAFNYEKLAYCFAVFYPMELTLQGVTGQEWLGEHNCFISPRICHKCIPMDDKDSVFYVAENHDEPGKAKTDSEDGESNSALKLEQQHREDGPSEAPEERELFQYRGMGTAGFRGFGPHHALANYSEGLARPANVRQGWPLLDVLGDLLSGTVVAAATESVISSIRAETSSLRTTSSSQGGTGTGTGTHVSGDGESIKDPISQQKKSYFDLDKYQFQLIFKLLHDEQWVEFISKDKGEVFSMTYRLMRSMGTIGPARAREQLLLELGKELNLSSDHSEAPTDNCSDLIDQFSSTLSDLNRFWLINSKSLDVITSPTLLDLDNYVLAVKRKYCGELHQLKREIELLAAGNYSVRYNEVAHLSNRAATAVKGVHHLFKLKATMPSIRQKIEEYKSEVDNLNKARASLSAFFNGTLDGEANYDYTEYREIYESYIQAKAAVKLSLNNCKEAFYNQYSQAEHDFSIGLDPTVIGRYLLCNKWALEAYLHQNLEEMTVCQSSARYARDHGIFGNNEALEAERPPSPVQIVIPNYTVQELEPVTQAAAGQNRVPEIELAPAQNRVPEIEALSEGEELPDADILG